MAKSWFQRVCQKESSVCLLSPVEASEHGESSDQFVPRVVRECYSNSKRSHRPGDRPSGPALRPGAFDTSPNAVVSILISPPLSASAHVQSRTDMSNMRARSCSRGRCIMACTGSRDADRPRLRSIRGSLPQTSPRIPGLASGREQVLSRPSEAPRRQSIRIDELACNEMRETRFFSGCPFMTRILVILRRLVRVRDYQYNEERHSALTSLRVDWS